MLDSRNTRATLRFLLASRLAGRYLEKMTPVEFAAPGLREPKINSTHESGSVVYHDAIRNKTDESG
jgi:hypothetical protein